MNPFGALLDLFIPRICHICDTSLLSDEDFVCSSCMSKLPRTGYEHYWKNTSGINTDLNPMEQRFAGQIPLGHAWAPFFYTRDSSLASLVHDFKYRGFPRLATVLGHFGASALASTDFFSNVDFLLPIPLHWTKRMRRGYNQCNLIAEGISSATGIPIGHQLKARKPHRTQTSLTSEQRIANTTDVFELTDSDSIRGKKVIIVDDICTTGATLLSAGKTIAASVNHNVSISLFTVGVV